MKIVHFAVWVECDGCDGKKSVPGGQREYGEPVACVKCDGKGVVPGVVDYADFARLLSRLVGR